MPDGRFGSQADILPQFARVAAMRCEAAPQLGSWRASQNGHKRPSEKWRDRILATDLLRWKLPREPMKYVQHELFPIMIVGVHSCGLSRSVF